MPKLSGLAENRQRRLCESDLSLLVAVNDSFNQNSRSGADVPRFQRRFLGRAR